MGFHETGYISTGGIIFSGFRGGGVMDVVDGMDKMDGVHGA